MDSNREQSFRSVPVGTREFPEFWLGEHEGKPVYVSSPIPIYKVGDTYQWDKLLFYLNIFRKTAGVEVAITNPDNGTSRIVIPMFKALKWFENKKLVRGGGGEAAEVRIKLNDGRSAEPIIRAQEAVLRLKELSENKPQNPHNAVINRYDSTISELTQIQILQIAQQIEKLKKQPGFQLYLDPSTEFQNALRHFANYSFGVIEVAGGKTAIFYYPEENFNRESTIGSKFRTQHEINPLYDFFPESVSPVYKDKRAGRLNIFDASFISLVSDSAGRTRVLSYFDVLLQNKKYVEWLEALFLYHRINSGQSWTGTSKWSIASDWRMLQTELFKKNIVWTSVQNLEEHWIKHGKNEMNFKSQEEYERASIEFVNSDEFTQIVLARQGTDVLIKYDFITKEIAILTKNGRIITYYIQTTKYRPEDKFHEYIATEAMIPKN